MEKPTLSIIIPVFNEENTILEILKQVRKTPYKKQIIIIDDASTDNTRSLLKIQPKKDITIIYNRKNHGKGYSLKKGFKLATNDIVIIQDADLEYYPDEYPQLIEKIVQGKADVVYGSRFLGSHRVFLFYHYLGNKLLNLITNILYDTNLTDLMTCYKAFRLPIVKNLIITSSGFSVEAEITAQIFKKNLKVYEVPISYNGRDYDEGKKISWLDFFRSLNSLLYYKFKSLDVGLDTAYRMRLAKNNNLWLFTTINPYLGKNILEVGSSIANISKFLVTKNAKIFLTDIDPYCLSYLKNRFISNPKVKVLNHDILTSPKPLLSSKINSVVAINILEHLENDNLALENINKTLTKNGCLILIVPAHKKLYGTLDKKLGHLRRYQKPLLIKKLKKAGFNIEKIYYLNAPAALGWYLNSVILKRKTLPSLQLKIIDRLIPLISKIEKNINPPFGLSLVAIARKT